MSDNREPWPPLDHVRNAKPLFSSEGTKLGEWTLLVVFFGLIAGVIGWFVVRRANPDRAFNILRWGVLWTIFWILVSWINLRAAQ